MILVLSEDIAQLEKQKGLLEPRLDFTSELEMIAEVCIHLLYMNRHDVC